MIGDENWNLDMGEVMDFEAACGRDLEIDTDPFRRTITKRQRLIFLILYRIMYELARYVKRHP